MRYSKFLAKTVKDTPRDAEIPSHIYMLRGGFMKQFSSGIYGLLPLALRSVAKIEKICRQEMNLMDGQEVRMPCSATKELWDETQRYETFGKDMIKFQDRNDKKMVLNPTHEEPVVAIARSEISSYKQLPMMIYQIQTKFRDEPRPRGGLVRLREFTMKDAYSFHTSEEDLNVYYNRMHEAYMRFFKRCGCKNFVSVLSDNGLFGGKYSHEFQMLVPSGEDKIITCSKCNYLANEEVSTSPFVIASEPEKELKTVHTENIKTISALCDFLSIKPEQTAKAVMYKTLFSHTPVICFVRGDLQAVDKKIRSLVGEEVVPACMESMEKAAATPGYTGPIGLNLKHSFVVFDHSIEKSSNLVTGANATDYHLINFNVHRDFLTNLSAVEKERVFIGDIAAARDGDPCPNCQAPLKETRGIEIGNIFHLGTKYTESMNCTYLDHQGKPNYPTMGCYGIGITRLLPAIIEEHHDEYGPIFPLPVAPFEVHLCVLNKKDVSVAEESEKLYQELKKLNIDVLFDDRDEKPGSQFADADLIGVPFRLILSPKTLAENSVELKYRDKRCEPRKIPLSEVIAILQNEISEEYKKYCV